MGPKLGYMGKDNGWLTLDKVRVPRANLLQKFLEVDSDGSVSVKGDMRALYATMMSIRVSLVNGAKLYLARALTIALRYSAVRR
jgi:acyl-CoA oxidase